MQIAAFKKPDRGFYQNKCQCQICNTLSVKLRRGPTMNSFGGTLIAHHRKNIARIANAVQCHSQLSGNKDCHGSGSQLSEL